MTEQERQENVCFPSRPSALVRRVLAEAAVGAALWGCAPGAKVVKQWSDPARTGPAYRKVLVLGVWSGERSRKVFEDQFVKELKAGGTDAMASYLLIPEDGQVSRERVIQAVDESGADAVLITQLLGRDARTKVYEGESLQYGGLLVDDDVSASYLYAWAGIYHTPREVDTDVWSLQSRLFDAKSRAPVWKGVSTVTNPTGLYEGTGQLAQVVVKALTAKKLL